MIYCVLNIHIYNIQLYIYIYVHIYIYDIYCVLNCYDIYILGLKDFLVYYSSIL